MAATISSFIVSGKSQGQALETVLMPGPVIMGHAEYETECSNCHLPFSRELQRDLCLNCHTQIAADLDAAAGFHGRSPTIPGRECASCHTEHEGRDADIVGLDRETFDHEATDFPLLGGHLAVECDSCHANATLFRDADSSCIACHREDDTHKGNLGETCSDCHRESNWSEASFDHDTTEFSLTGMHADLVCAGCHRNERYQETPGQCVDCHRVDDTHAGNNGDSCENCHATSGWSETSFDHFAQTGFGLDGAHGRLICEACHEGNKFEQSVAAECDSCHQADDIHGGNNGNQCAGCHAPTQWSDVSFDHAVTAGFALAGAHEALICTACHKGAVDTARPDASCNGCHWSDDVHQAQLGENCATCHGPTGWTESIRFDHDFTRFPLLGLHAAVACEGCHASPTFHDAGEQCVDCHLEDDVHDNRLGSACASCHNPNDWLIWQFDHNTETEFRLDGAHAGLACLACHDRPVTDAIQMSMTCESCHRSDDIHRGSFGTDCGLCHSTSSWR